MSISLTPLEDRICTVLDECAKDIRQNNPSAPEVQCRIAGGWVRDKLLGLESDDIDVALSDMMGSPFAEAFSSFLKSRDVEVGSVVLIPANSEMSKHLEPARMRAFGLELDFVNLRSEDYAENSRIPSTIRFGTPLEDALRRDLTINALFYNVHTRSVEDFTGKGLDDLRDRMIRTPLPPRETFLDDPLRVLRAIRFASRFGFTSADDLKAAVVQPEIREALSVKVSRERFGIEVEKMLKGPDPLMSLEMICDLSLYSTIFCLNPTNASTLSGTPVGEHAALVAARVLHRLLGPDDPSKLSILDRARADSAVRKKLYLAAALTPFRLLTYTDPEKKKTAPAAEGIVRDGLKLGNHDRTASSALFQAASLIEGPVLSRFAAPQRVSIGLLLRNPAVHNPVTGTHWADSTSFALAQELVPLWTGEGNGFSDAAKDDIEVYREFVEFIQRSGLPDAIEEKPRLSGTEVAAALNVKPGAFMTTVLNQIVEWQLEHPEGSKEECEAWLKTAAETGAIRLDTKPAKQDRPTEGQPVSKRPRKK